MRINHGGHKSVESDPKLTNPLSGICSNETVGNNLVKQGECNFTPV